jgi:hypothetical protein
MTPCTWPGTRAGGYDLGPDHPTAPLRPRLTMELAQAFALDRPDGTMTVVPAATIDQRSSPSGKPSSRCGLVS